MVLFVYGIFDRIRIILSLPFLMPMRILVRVHDRDRGKAKYPWPLKGVSPAFCIQNVILMASPRQGLWMGMEY